MNATKTDVLAFTAFRVSTGARSVRTIRSSGSAASMAKLHKPRGTDPAVTAELEPDDYGRPPWNASREPHDSVGLIRLAYENPALPTSALASLQARIPHVLDTNATEIDADIHSDCATNITIVLHDPATSRRGAPTTGSERATAAHRPTSDRSR